MEYSAKDVLDFVEDNSVQFIRCCFCDIFGTQKNIAIPASCLPSLLEEGVYFDGSSVAGFMNVEESDLVLRPDCNTMALLPWRALDGQVMQLICDIYRPNGQPFEGNCRSYLRQVTRRYQALGITCNVGIECEFYLFEKDENGRPCRIPIDKGGYFDIDPLDKGENVRRDICLTMEAMGLHPQHSHHESGYGQNEIDLRYGDALETADHFTTYKRVVKAMAGRNGFYASFMPKPLPDQAGSGLHINISLTKGGRNLFENELSGQSVAGHFIAGVLQHIRELTIFTNPLPNSYARFGVKEAPRYVSWSRENRSQLVRIPAAHGSSCRMELRSPDPACNPYLTIGLILAAGLEGIERQLPLPAPVNCNLFRDNAPPDLAQLPETMAEAIALAQNSAFLQRELPAGLAEKYLWEERRRDEEMRTAADPAKLERERYFEVI